MKQVARLLFNRKSQGNQQAGAQGGGKLEPYIGIHLVNLIQDPRACQDGSGQVTFLFTWLPISSRRSSSLVAERAPPLEHFGACRLRQLQMYPAMCLHGARQVHARDGHAGATHEFDAVLCQHHTCGVSLRDTHASVVQFLRQGHSAGWASVSWFFG